jgi:hypothetical protein
MVGLSLLDEEDVTPAGQAQAAVAAIGEESSAVRAERLNASLTEKEKASAVTVESSPAQPEPEHQPEASPAPPPVLPEPTTSAPVVTPPAGQAPPADSTGLLSEEEVAKLEASLSALPQPKRGIDYMVHRGWLEKGKPLNQTTQSAFKNITTKTPAFVRMVDGWKGQL